MASTTAADCSTNEPRPVRSTRVAGASLVHVSEVEVVIVQLELVAFQDPSPLAPVAQRARPCRRADDLVRPPSGGDLRERPADVQYGGVRGVVLHELPIHPVHVGGPPEVVSVRQAAGLAVTLGDAGAIRHIRFEGVALLEGPDADAVLLRYGPESGHEASVDDPGLEVARGLRRRPEVRVLQ